MCTPNEETLEKELKTLVLCPVCLGYGSQYMTVPEEGIVEVYCYFCGGSGMVEEINSWEN